MTDDELIARFENCTISKECFHHLDHVRAAFLYLCRYATLEALQGFSGSLMRFAAHQGAPGRYHETVTWAYVFLIRERMARAHRLQSWPEFAAANEDLLAWKNNILKNYYRPDTLNSDLAKRVFLFPDNF